MTETELISELSSIVSRVVFQPVTLTPTTTANDIEGWDSLSHTIIMMQLERALGIRIPVEETFALRNVGELVHCIAPLTERDPDAGK